MRLAASRVLRAWNRASVARIALCPPLVVGLGHQPGVARKAPAPAQVAAEAPVAARRPRERVGDVRSTGVERLVDDLDDVQVVGREPEPVHADQPVAHEAQVLEEQLAAGRHRLVGVEELRHRGRGVERRRPGPREQTGHEVGAVRRQLHQRLVEEMEQQVLAADVDDERQPRPERYDVGEVLLGADTEVDAARRRAPLELGDDRLERGLVRHQVVGPEVALRLGEARDHAPERRDRRCDRRGRGRPAGAAGRRAPRASGRAPHPHRRAFDVES